MTPEENARFQKECNGCPALDDQLERVRKTDGLLVAARAKIEIVKAIADALVKEPRVKQIGEELHRALAGELPAGRIGGVDRALAPGGTARQNWLTFSCPAGCSHKALIPEGATMEEAGAAISQATGLVTWLDGDAICWASHEAVAAGNIEVCEPDQEGNK
jgi:hypothetical protein